jgi:hypothetical protein
LKIIKNALCLLIGGILSTVNVRSDDGQNGPSDRLIQALIRVESSGNTRAIGDKERDHKAYGPLQVRQLVCDDINNRYHTNYRAEDCLGNVALSITIFKKYVIMWAKESRLGHIPTDADYARIWNGGPEGWRRKATEGYIAKVIRAGGIKGRGTYLANK